MPGPTPDWPAGSTAGAITAGSSSSTFAIAMGSPRSSSMARTHRPTVLQAASRVRPEFVLEVLGEVAPRLAGTENAKLPTGEIELRATRADDPVRGKDAALLHQRPRRGDRRERPTQVPLPGHPPRGHAAEPAPAQPDGPGDPRGPPRQRVRRGRDPDADQEHARRARATSSSRAGSSPERCMPCRRARSSSSSC